MEIRESVDFENILQSENSNAETSSEHIWGGGERNESLRCEKLMQYEVVGCIVRTYIQLSLYDLLTCMACSDTHHRRHHHHHHHQRSKMKRSRKLKTATGEKRDEKTNEKKYVKWSNSHKNI